MRTIAWGLTMGLVCATAVGFGPILLLGVTGQGFDDLTELGGVRAYLLWAYAAGTIGGISAGIARFWVTSDLGLRVACGVVLAEVFSLQALFLGSNRISSGIVVFMAIVAFAMGVIVGPIMVRGLAASWPTGLYGWGAPAASVEVSDPVRSSGVPENDETRDR